MTDKEEETGKELNHRKRYEEKEWMLGLGAGVVIICKWASFLLRPFQPRLHSQAGR